MSAMIHRLGWSIAIEPPPGDTLNQPKVTFRRKLDVPSVDMQAFRMAITTLIARALFPRESTAHDTVKVQLKLWDTWTPEFSWPGSLRIDQILEPWRQASRHTGEESRLRAICHGTRLNEDFALDAYRSLMQPQSALRIHMVLHIHGGGSKLEANQKLRQTLAEFMLQIGADPVGVNEFVRDLCDKAGLSRVQHVLQIRDSDERLAQILRLAKSMCVKPIIQQRTEIRR